VPSATALALFQGASTLTTGIAYDQTTNGYNSTGTGATRPFLTASENWHGIQPFVFDGAPSATTRELALPAGLTSASQSLSVFAVVRPLSSFQGSSYVQLGATGANILNFWQLNGFSNGPGGYDGTSFLTNPSFANQVRAQPAVIGITSSAAAITYYVDSIVATGAAPASHATAGGLIGAWSGSNGANLSADYFALVIYGSTLNTTQSAAVIAALQAAFPGTARAATRNQVYDGDSIMFGAGLIGTGALNNLQRQTEALLNHPVNSWNVALSGATLATEASGYAAKIAPLYDATKTSNIMFQQGGTNDLIAGTSATTLETTIQSNATAAHSTGYKFVCATILPRTGFTGAEQTQWTAYNTWLRANEASFCDGFADFQNDPTMGPFSAASNTSLYGDGVHPTTLGYSYLARLIRQRAPERLASVV
jgi:lysophospholipase L1-like esterase